MISLSLLISSGRYPVPAMINIHNRLYGNMFSKANRIPILRSAADYRTCPGPPTDSCHKHRITYKPYVPVVSLDHDHKNMMLGRPMSPHLDIYGPTVPAMTSIAQRITGVAVTGYTLIMAGGTLFLPKGIHSIVEFIQNLNLSEPIVLSIKTVLAIMFTFHYFIGIRFVMFNLGKWLDLKPAYQTAYLAIVLSCVTAVAGALIGHLY